MIWFGSGALFFVPTGTSVYENSGAPGGLDGDPAAVAVTWTARALFGGLALISLALIDWAASRRAIEHALTGD